MLVCHNCELPVDNGPGAEDSQPLCTPCTALSERTPPIHVTPLGREDLELVLAWRSNEQIYRHFRKQDGPLDWDQHISWYDSRPTDRHDFVIHYKDRRVGVISVDTTDEVSIYLGDFSSHGHGVATATLRWLCKRFADRTPLMAEIHEDNESSKRLFERCEFHQEGRDGSWMEYLYEP
jgi:RimJ/RimL family protein N-acetyltransferase